jgi:hypothetical protein
MTVRLWVIVGLLLSGLPAAGMVGPPRECSLASDAETCPIPCRTPCGRLIPCCIDDAVVPQKPRPFQTPGASDATLPAFPFPAHAPVRRPTAIQLPPTSSERRARLCVWLN